MASPAELKRLSLEELMTLDVTSVSKRSEPWFATPSAIQVITDADIHRSGASSLPEALQLAPNLEVAQVDSRQWAISARGFNNGLANKLLVLRDGRTVYSPLFAGVFWDVQDTLLEDIDRIEVISGPGGTVWGENAVNGVINVITKSAQETQGALLSAGGGTQLQDFVSGRYGGRIGSNLFFRIYGKYFDRNSTLLPDGQEAANDWRFGQGGFRMDWLPPGGDTLTLQGDGYSGSMEQVLPENLRVDGQNVLSRWTHPLGLESDLRVQMYWDRTYRRQPGSFTENLNTYDVDFTHRFPLSSRQVLIWGGGYRLMADEFNSATTNFAILPPKRNLQLFSGFLQDEITLVPERWRVTLGTKIEHNDFSGFEFEPSGRIAWTPTERITLWGAGSRAVRAPSRIDRDFFVPADAPFQIAGGPDFESEKLIAGELGWRFRPVDQLTFSAAGFYNHYEDVRSLSTNMPATLRNDNRAEEWGVELSGNLELTRWWRLRVGYTWLDKRVELKAGGSDLNRGRAEGNDPENQVLVHSMIDLPFRLQLDCVFRYVDPLPQPRVPSYVTVDVRLGWQLRPDLEVSIVGRNLCDNQHPEFGAPGTRQEIPRSVYGKVSWSF